MDQNKANKILIIMTSISIVILLIGTTFSYFTISNKSKKDALTATSYDVNLILGISSLTSNKKLIPTRDEDIQIAYRQNCVDDNGFGACMAYSFELFNYNKEQDIIGTISFDVTDIDNLSYMILDENNNVYLDKTSIPNGTTDNLPLGEHFIMGEGTKEVPSTKKFVLVIWLSNKEEDQTSYDASGEFTANVSYESVSGAFLTGTIEGEELDTTVTSLVGGDNINE